MTHKLSEHAGGGLVYTPAMMEHDGSGGYTSSTSLAITGNKVTILMRFKIPIWTGGAFYRLFRAENSSNGTVIGVIAFPSDYSDTDRQGCIEFYVADSGGGAGVQAYTVPDTWLDNNPHTMLLQFDGDAGTASMIVDGTDALDATNPDYTAANTAVLTTIDQIGFGSNPSGANSAVGDIGFLGYDNSAGHTWSDFMTAEGYPRELDESGWVEWGSSQPQYFNPHGFMLDNRGSKANMTASGTIIISDSGSTGHPILGLSTTGTAVAADIATGETAWVDGVQITGTAP